MSLTGAKDPCVYLALNPLVARSHFDPYDVTWFHLEVKLSLEIRRFLTSYLEIVGDIISGQPCESICRESDKRHDYENSHFIYWQELFLENFILNIVHLYRYSSNISLEYIGKYTFSII